LNLEAAGHDDEWQPMIIGLSCMLTICFITDVAERHEFELVDSVPNATFLWKIRKTSK
jgi:hypothetical protein